MTYLCHNVRARTHAARSQPRLAREQIECGMQMRRRHLGAHMQRMSMHGPVPTMHLHGALDLPSAWMRGARAMQQESNSKSPLTFTFALSTVVVYSNTPASGTNAKKAKAMDMTAGGRFSGDLCMRKVTLPQSIHVLASRVMIHV